MSISWVIYKANGGSDSVEQTSATLTVAEATSATQVASIGPTSIIDGVATSITLSGTVDYGDMVTWVESSVACNTVIPDVDPLMALMPRLTSQWPVPVHTSCATETAVGVLSVEQSGAG